MKKAMFTSDLADSHFNSVGFNFLEDLSERENRLKALKEQHSKVVKSIAKANLDNYHNNIGDNIDKAMCLLRGVEYEPYSIYNKIRSSSFKKYDDDLKTVKGVSGVYQIKKEYIGKNFTTETEVIGYATVKFSDITKCLFSKELKELWCYAIEKNNCLLSYNEFITFISDDGNMEITRDILLGLNLVSFEYENKNLKIDKIYFFIESKKMKNYGI